MLLKNRSYTVLSVMGLMVLMMAACGPVQLPTPTAGVDTAVPEPTEMSTEEPAETMAATEGPAETMAPTDGPDATDDPNATTTAPDEVVINVANDATLGDFLVDGDGMTLYMFTNDTPGVSACEGGCLEAWPPLLIAEGSTPTAGEGVTATLGVITRSDGTMQVTINELPAYYYAEDEEPGDVTGQGVNDKWYVFDPAGTPVQP